MNWLCTREAVPTVMAQSQRGLLKWRYELALYKGGSAYCDGSESARVAEVATSIGSVQERQC